MMSLVRTPGPTSKTPSVQTLGVLLFGLFYSGWTLAADCMPEGQGELAVVERVYDGDTVKLKDGRHVRVLGVNTPEVDHGNEPTGQPLGEEAKKATENFLGKNTQVRLFYDVQRVDRYERTLAHIYDSKGNSLGANLLRKGLAFHVAIPPNLSLNQCLQGQERIGRRVGLGIWNHPGWRAIAASDLRLNDTGFKRITGKVVSVRKAQSIWLELDGPLVIKITPSDLPNFSEQQWSNWKGRSVEVRGWVTERGGEEEGKRRTKSAAKKSFKSLVIQPRIGANLELLP